MSRRSIASVIVLGLTVAACAGEARVASVTTTSAPIAARGDDSIDGLAAARCDREAACRNVGNGQKYESHARCVREVGAQTREAMQGTPCPAGIDRAQLGRCFAEVSRSFCDNLATEVSALDPCRPRALCAGEDWPPEGEL